MENLRLNAYLEFEIKQFRSQPFTEKEWLAFCVKMSFVSFQVKKGNMVVLPIKSTTTHAVLETPFVLVKSVKKMRNCERKKGSASKCLE